LLRRELNGESSFSRLVDADEQTRLAGIFRDRLDEKIKNTGLSTDAAALYLGMTTESFTSLIRAKVAGLTVFPCGGEPRFLKSELEAFQEAYLPRHKTWSRRRTMAEEFFRELRERTGVGVTPQPCEEPGCPDLADVRCSNPDCRPGRAPRAVCARHEERDWNDLERSFCPQCVRRFLYGDLKERIHVAGSPERLRETYPKNGSGK
jgi:hypothetical protein